MPRREQRGPAQSAIAAIADPFNAVRKTQATSVSLSERHRADRLDAPPNPGNGWPRPLPHSVNWRIVTFRLGGMLLCASGHCGPSPPPSPNHRAQRRDARPISTVQQQDVYSDCAMIRAEIDGNNQKAQELANEQGMKVAQNVAAGVVGLVIWPVWFGMDFKGAAGQDAANLQARQEYLDSVGGPALRAGISTAASSLR